MENKAQIRQIRAQIEARKREYPLEWLGRSLAYNPYMPRELSSVLASTERSCKIIARLKSGNALDTPALVREAQRRESDSIDALLLACDSPMCGNLEYITHIRRYTALPLLYEGIILDVYQILEALVYGVDAIFLHAGIVSLKELKTLLEYAIHVGLLGIVEIASKEDLAKAMLVGAQALAIPYKCQANKIDMTLAQNLMPLIPNGKIIIATSKDTSCAQSLKPQAYGIDAFVI